MPHLFHNNVESSWILPSAKMSSQWYLHGSGFGDNGPLRATSKVQSYVLHDGCLRSCSQKFFLKKITDEVTSSWAIVHRETNVYTLWNTLKWAISALWVLHHLIHSSNTNAIGQIQQKPEPREIAPRTGKLRKLHAVQLTQQIQHFTRNSKGHLLTHGSKRTKISCNIILPELRTLYSGASSSRPAEQKKAKLAMQNRWKNHGNLGIQVT